MKRNETKAFMAIRVTVYLLFILLLFHLPAGPASGEDKMEVYHQSWHASMTNTIAFSPDGRFAVSGGDDQMVRLWDIAKEAEIRRFIGHKGLVSSVCFSPDGRYLLSGSWDHTLKLWDVESGKALRSFNGHSGFVSAAAFSPDGRHAVSGSHDKSIKLWEIDTGKELKTFFGHTGYVTSVAFSPDGRFVLSGSRDKTLILWHVESGEDLKTFSGHADQVHTIAFSPDGYNALSASDDRTLILWDIRGGREIKTLKGHAGQVCSASFSLDGRFALSADKGGAMVFWDIKTGKALRTFAGASEGLKAAILSPDGRHALSGGSRLALWDITTGKEIKSFPVSTALFNASALPYPYGRYTLSEKVVSVLKMIDVTSGRDMALKVNAGNDEWIIVTPEGYFDSSPEGTKYLKIRIGNDAYGMEQFYNRFYRPDMVQMALAGKELFEAEEDVVHIVANKPAPSVDIVLPAAESTVSVSKIALSIHIKNNRGGMGNVFVYRNGSQVIHHRQRPSPTNETPAQKLNFPVSLVPGDNSIRVIAFNWDGSMASTPVFLTIRSNTGEAKPTLHALIVGISQYGNERLSMKYAASDAETFADALKRCAEPVYGRVNLTVLSSFERARKEEIKKSLKQIQGIMKPNDTFVFYMASLGLNDLEDSEFQYYLFTSQVRFFSSHQIAKQALSLDELAALIGNMPSQRKLIIFDTCHAAATSNPLSIHQLKRNRGLTATTAFKLLQRTTGDTVFFSLSDTQKASRGYQNQNLFSYVLNGGFRAMAAADSNGIMTVRSLAGYLRPEMEKTSMEAFQEKISAVAEVGTDFPLAKTR